MKTNSLFILVILISASYQVVQDKLQQSTISSETKELVKTAVAQEEVHQGVPGWPVVMELPTWEKDKHMSWVNFYRKIAAEEELDYMAFESILQTPKYDKKSAPTLLPYDPLYKFGQGFNLEDGSGRASPFISDILYNAKPDSLEGTDGKISSKIYTSAKEFALDIAASLGVKYEGFGVKAASEFAMDASYSISSEEVVLRSTHWIDGGKSIFSQDKLKLSKEAKYTLATDQQAFRNAYGTHFIVGFTVQCDMDIYYRRKVTDKNQKYAVGTKMSLDTKFVEVNGALDVSLEMKQSMDQTDVEIKYTGTDGTQYIQGLNIQQLQQALMEFPDKCDTGNVRDYILWPYQQVNSYQKVIADIHKAHTIAELEAQKARVVEETDVDVLEEPTDAITVLDRLYTAAILEVKIVANSIGQEKTHSIAEQDKKKDRVFELSLYEMVLFDQYEEHKAQLEASEDRVQDIHRLRKAKKQIDTGRINVLSEHGNGSAVVNAMEVYYDQQQDIEDGDYQCNVPNCVTCSLLSAESCSICDDGFDLDSNGGCSGWVVIFKQSEGSVYGSQAWMKINDKEDGEFMDNYSILHRIDNSYRNDQSRFEFRMTWPRDFDDTDSFSMHWYQSSTPWKSATVSGFQSIQNDIFGETFKGLRHYGDNAVMSAGPKDGQFFEYGEVDYFQAGTLAIVAGEIRGPVNEILSDQTCSSTSRCYACQGSCLVNSDCQQGLICRKTEDKWEKLGTDRDWMAIAVETSGVLWALKTDEQIYKKVNDESDWEKIPGSKDRISAGNDGVWGVNSGGEIYKYGHRDSNWVRVEGGLADIGTGADGTTWGINSNDEIYRYEGNNDWTKIEGKLDKISVDSNGHAIGINSQKDIWQWLGSKFRHVPSDKDGVDIEVGKDDSMWYWTASGVVKRRTGDSWVEMSGVPKVQAMAVLSEREYYVIDTYGQLQKYTGAERNGEVKLPGCVGVTSPGSNYCVNPDIKSNTVTQVVLEVKTH